MLFKLLHVPTLTLNAQKWEGGGGGDKNLSYQSIKNELHTSCTSIKVVIL